MALARAVATATLALRNEAGINVRQPLPALLVVTGSGGVDEGALRSMEGVVLDEVNVKRLDTADGATGVVAKSAKPNFKALGRTLGPRMKAAQAAIGGLDTDTIARYEADGALTLVLPDGPLGLVAGDLDIVSEGVDGRAVRQETALLPDGRAQVVTVALDTEISAELRAEGIAREAVNRVQNLRKEAGFAVSDRIVLTFQAPPTTARAFRAHAETIRTETLAVAFDEADAPTGEATATADLGDGPTTFAVSRAERPAP